MTQDKTITNSSNGTLYTFQSTTDATTITIGDNQFSQCLHLQALTDAIKGLTNALRSLNG